MSLIYSLTWVSEQISVTSTVVQTLGVPLCLCPPVIEGDKALRDFKLLLLYNFKGRPC